MTYTSYAAFPRYNSVTRASFVGLRQQDDDPERPLALSCRAVSVGEPRLVDGRVGYTVRLRDLAGHQQIESQPITDPDCVERALTAVQQGHRMIAYGSLCAPARPGGGLRIELIDLKPMSRPTSMLGPGAEESDRARAALARFAQAPGSFESFLKERLYDLCGVASGSLSPRFRAATDLVLLQALSFGQVQRDVNPRLSLYMLSGPGSGKKKIAEMARALAPVSQLVQPTQFTPAGISARVEMTRGGFVAHPGVLPLCSGGVCVFDDVHRVERRHANTFQGILMSVLEDARVAPVKAASASYAADVALLMLSNRMSMIDGNLQAMLEGPHARTEEVGLLWDVLTRIDVILSLDLGDDAAKSARDIFLQQALEEDLEAENRPSGAGEGLEDPRARELKLLIATALEQVPSVDFSAVAKEGGRMIDEYTQVVREYGARLVGRQQEVFNADGLLRRGANSFKKLVAASARLDLRKQATPEDLERAWSMASYKLELIKWVCGQAERIAPQGSRERQVQRARAASDERFRNILLHYGGQQVTAGEVAHLLGYGEPTVRRELRGRGLKPEKGRYLVPTVDQWERRLEEGEGGPAAPEPECQEASIGPTEEEELAAAEHPDEPEPEAQVRFDDNVKELPSRVNLLFTLVALSCLRTQHFLSNQLLKVAFEPDAGEAHMPAHLFLAEVQREARERGEPGLPYDLYQEVRTKLMDPEWGNRGLYALRLYTYAGLPDAESKIRGHLKELTQKGIELPEPVRQAAEGVLKRLEYAWEQRRPTPKTDLEAYEELSRWLYGETEEAGAPE